VQNAVKHASATGVRVALTATAADLGLEVRDDGIGVDAARPVEGAGLANMRDRVESLGGTLTVAGRPGGGTRVSGRIPLGPPQGGPDG
jgi:signal transduction histidine kinase